MTIYFGQSVKKYENLNGPDMHEGIKFTHEQNEEFNTKFVGKVSKIFGNNFDINCNAETIIPQKNGELIIDRSKYVHINGKTADIEKFRTILDVFGVHEAGIQGNNGYPISPYKDKVILSKPQAMKFVSLDSCESKIQQGRKSVERLKEPFKRLFAKSNINIDSIDWAGDKTIEVTLESPEFTDFFIHELGFWHNTLGVKHAEENRHLTLYRCNGKIRISVTSFDILYSDILAAYKLNLDNPHNSDKLLEKLGLYFSENKKILKKIIVGYSAMVIFVDSPESSKIVADKMNALHRCLPGTYFISEKSGESGNIVLMRDWEVSRYKFADIYKKIMSIQSFDKELSLIQESAKNQLEIQHKDFKENQVQLQKQFQHQEDFNQKRLQIQKQISENIEIKLVDNDSKVLIKDKPLVISILETIFSQLQIPNTTIEGAIKLDFRGLESFCSNLEMSNDSRETVKNNINTYINKVKLKGNLVKRTIFCNQEKTILEFNNNRAAETVKQSIIRKWNTKPVGINGPYMLLYKETVEALKQY